MMVDKIITQDGSTNGFGTNGETSGISRLGEKMDMRDIVRDLSHRPVIGRQYCRIAQ